MVQPGPDPDNYPPIDPTEPVPDDPGELLPDTPETLPPAPVVHDLTRIDAFFARNSPEVN